MKEKESSFPKQLLIISLLFGGFLVGILVLAGSDFYIQRWNLSRFLEIILNILSALLSFVSGVAFFSYFLNLHEKRKVNNQD
jgi:hypothetical protein